MSVMQDEIDRIREGLNALEAMLPNDKALEPKPRAWRPWDIVRSTHGVIYIRDWFISDFPWVRIIPHDVCVGHSFKESEVQVEAYLGNLAGILVRGDVLVGLTEEETTHIRERWAHLNDGSTMAGVAHKCEAAMLARKEDSCS